MSWKTRLATFLLALLALVPLPALADVFLSGDFSLTPGEDPGEYTFTAQVPEAVAERASVTWPDGCREAGMTRQSVGGRAQFAFALRCDRPFSASDVIRTPWQLDGGRFLSTAGSQRIDRPLSTAVAGDLLQDGAPSSTGMTIPLGADAVASRPVSVLAPEFTRQGLWHILFGWDHLAFVLCLALLARGRQLVGLVTCFTLGHSLSLGLAFFEMIHAPVPPVEAAIALSIVFMAREALLVTRGAVPFAFRRQIAVVSAFGLLHGLGFATALGELGVGEGEKLASLAFFNLGVELGQLLFVSGVMVMLAAIKWASTSAALPARAFALYAVGAVGSFWLVERVAGFAVA